jgi:geranylgeranyl pyrophosphate synthase
MFDEVENIARLLSAEGGYSAAYDAAQQMTDLALLNLQEADPQGEPGDELYLLTHKLLKRNQ